MTRTCLAAGRPLGFLLAWLHHSEVPTRAEHWDRTGWIFSHEERSHLREEMLKTQDGQQLASFERPRREGEGIEPDTLEGLMA